MPWCARCGTGISQHEMTEGYADRTDPGLTVRFPLRRPAGRGAPGLDDDALDAHQQRGRRRRAGPALRQGPPGRRRPLAGQGDPPRRPSPARSRCSRSVAGSELVGLALPGPVRRPAGGPGRLRRRRARRPPVRAPRRRLGRGRRGGGHRDRPHRARLRRRGLRPRQGARPADAGAARRGRHLHRRLRVPRRPRRPRLGRAVVEHLQAPRALLPPGAVRPPLPALLALRHAARLPPGRRVVHQHGPGLRPAARAADAGRGRREPPLPDHGRRRRDPVDPRRSATSGSSTGSSTCTTG